MKIAKLINIYFLLTIVSWNLQGQSRTLRVSNETINSVTNSSRETKQKKYVFDFLKKEITNNEYNKIEDIIHYLQQFPASISEFNTQQTVFIYDSKSPIGSSLERPRIIGVNENASFAFGVASHSDMTNGNLLEIIEYDTTKNKYIFKTIDFSGEKPIFNSHANSKCVSCHSSNGDVNNMKMIWESYPNWPGVYGSVSSHGIMNRTRIPKLEMDGLRSLYQGFLNESLPPRLSFFYPDSSLPVSSRNIVSSSALESQLEGIDPERLKTRSRLERLEQLKKDNEYPVSTALADPANLLFEYRVTYGNMRRLYNNLIKSPLFAKYLPLLSSRRFLDKPLAINSLLKNRHNFPRGFIKKIFQAQEVLDEKKAAEIKKSLNKKEILQLERQLPYSIVSQRVRQKTLNHLFLPLRDQFSDRGTFISQHLYFLEKNLKIDLRTVSTGFYSSKVGANHRIKNTAFNSSTIEFYKKMKGHPYATDMENFLYHFSKTTSLKRKDIDKVLMEMIERATTKNDFLSIFELSHKGLDIPHFYTKEHMKKLNSLLSKNLSKLMSLAGSIDQKKIHNISLNSQLSLKTINALKKISCNNIY